MEIEGIQAAGSLGKLVFARTGRSKRVSSWDKSGGNDDWIRIEPGETAILADIPGAGCVRHLWFTVNVPEDQLYMRKLVLKAYWDGETEPSVLSPLGDFFCLGHSIAQSFTTIPFTCVTPKENQDNYGGGVAFNCYFAMPFGKGARFELVNEGDKPAQNFYYYIDYDEYDSLPDDVLRFHAQYRQEYTTQGTQGDLSAQGINYWRQMKTPNLDGNENYLVFEAEGRGHFVGCNLSVDNLDPIVSKRKVGSKEVDFHELTWWGEGDDMFFIDGDQWPPSLHGTGSEDYFTQAWGMHNFQGIYAGTSVNETATPATFSERHQLTCYRFHIEDPVLFRERIRFSIEHGHANLQSNDYSSVAYWYQTEPHKPFEPLPSVEERTPKRIG